MNNIKIKKGEIFILSTNFKLQTFNNYTSVIKFIQDNKISNYKLWVRVYKNYIPVSEYLLI